MTNYRPKRPKRAATDPRRDVVLTITVHDTICTAAAWADHLERALRKYSYMPECDLNSIHAEEVR